MTADLRNVRRSIVFMADSSLKSDASVTYSFTAAATDVKIILCLTNQPLRYRGFSRLR